MRSASTLPSHFRLKFSTSRRWAPVVPLGSAPLEDMWLLRPGVATGVSTPTLTMEVAGHEERGGGVRGVGVGAGGVEERGRPHFDQKRPESVDFLICFPNSLLLGFSLRKNMGIKTLSLDAPTLCPSLVLVQVCWPCRPLSKCFGSVCPAWPRRMPAFLLRLMRALSRPCPVVGAVGPFITTLSRPYPLLAKAAFPFSTALCMYVFVWL